VFADGATYRDHVRRAMAAIAVLFLALVATAGAQMPGMPEQKRMMRWDNTLFVLFDQLEYAANAVGRPIDLDGKAWYGGAYQRLWLRGQGEIATVGTDAEGEIEPLYGRLVAPFWDAVVGVHVDQHWGGEIPTRTMLVLGLIGLAPYRIELEPTLFIGTRGEVLGRVEGGFPLLLTQRLIMEPEFEINAALQAVPRHRVRQGINDYELGLRLRYEIRREFAPYAGLSRSRRLRVGTERSDIPQTRFVTGFRIWY